ncbi:hypothetical protein [Mesorhizobium sp. NZP2077]|uniref:hypothetical protein n=1 Tax=Mesorhizobium sp. NZP2077 TaxID=2483404 RepID=UPI001552A5CB|nr:hypothetical protein [Mesorhizobium sp. NZP2077]QKC82613.1 hypothetical protein EB232_14220 [Mesorhizobium sp. NZP2077]QKD16111.1 hypothetical protein HGP13_14035 [Mesorhizobium sp. NZP2077]
MKTPPALSRAGLETNEPDLSCRVLSSRIQPAAPLHAAASLGVGGREGEHGAKLAQEARRVKISALAQGFVAHLPAMQRFYEISILKIARLISEL